MWTAETSKVLVPSVDTERYLQRFETPPKQCTWVKIGTTVNLVVVEDKLITVMFTPANGGPVISSNVSKYGGHVRKEAVEVADVEMEEAATPEAKLNKSKHAPAEQSKRHHELAKRQAKVISADIDAKERKKREEKEEKEKAMEVDEGAGKNEKEKEKETKKEDKGPTIWDRILGEGWDRECTVEVGDYYQFMFKILEDMKAIKSEKATNNKAKNNKKKKLTKKVTEIARDIGEFLDMAGKWKESTRGLMLGNETAIQEWREGEKQRVEESTQSLVKQTADTVCIITF